MEVIAELAEDYSFDELRITHKQNVVLAHVRQADLHALWQRLDAAGLATANIGLATDIIACPGLDYCNLANARSIPVAQQLSHRLGDPDRQAAIGGLRINISGCINACGHHHVGDIGLLGVDRKGEEYYQITLGGSSDENAAIGEIIGPAFAYDDVIGAVDRVVETYLSQRRDGELFGETYRRVGPQALLRINISGCINACGHHHVGDIGLLGVDRKGEEYYQITLGGSSDENAAIGEIIGPAFAYDDVIGAVDRVVETYLSQRRDGELFGETYRRVGPQPFKENLYGAA